MRIKTQVVVYDMPTATWKLVKKEAKRFKNQKYAQLVMVERLGKKVNFYEASKRPIDIYLDDVAYTEGDKEALRNYRR